MDKFAQRRGLWSKIYDAGNIVGKSSEEYFNPELKEMMETLREVDNNVRSTAAGESIDGGNVDGQNISLKDLLKKSKDHFKTREYILSIKELSEFHFKMEKIVENLKKIDEKLMKDVHHKFLTPDDWSEEDYKYFKELGEKFNKKSNLNYKLISNAGWFGDLFGSDRQRALSFWEKTYPKQIKKLKSDLNNLLSSSDSLLSTLLSSLKSMSMSRAKRDVEGYNAQSRNIFKKFNEYHLRFGRFYSEHVVGFLKQKNPPETVTESSEKMVDQVENVIKPSESTLKPSEPAVKSLESPDLSNKKEPASAETEQYIDKFKEIEPSFITQQSKKAFRNNKEYLKNSPRKPHDTEIVCPLCNGEGFDYLNKSGDIKKGNGNYVCRLCLNIGVIPKEAILDSNQNIRYKIQNLKKEINNIDINNDKSENKKESRDKIKEIYNLLSDLLDKLYVENKSISRIVPLKNPPEEDQIENHKNNLIRLIDNTITKTAHIDFIHFLESMSNESPKILKSVIIKYAKNIYKSDPNFAKKLIKISNNIVN